MDCRDAQFFLRFRRVGPDELGPAESAALDAHLGGCTRCAADARAAFATDVAFAAAMRDVPIPGGLRDRLVAAAFSRRGVAVRRKVYRFAAVAASLMLAVGLGIAAFTASRPHPDTLALAMQGDAVGDAHAAEATVRQWLGAKRLPAIPEDFDYHLLLTYGSEEVQGRDVPVVVFRERNGPGFAKVYAFRTTTFDLKGVREAQSSYCRAKPYPDPVTGVTYLIVFTGQDLAPFLRGAGGPVVLRV